MSKTSSTEHHLAGKPSNNRKASKDKALAYLHIYLHKSEKLEWEKHAKNLKLILSKYIIFKLKNRACPYSQGKIYRNGKKTYLQIRCKMSDKNNFVKESQKLEMSLSVWIRSKVNNLI